MPRPAMIGASFQAHQISMLSRFRMVIFPRASSSTPTRHRAPSRMTNPPGRIADILPGAPDLLADLSAPLAFARRRRLSIRDLTKGRTTGSRCGLALPTCCLRLPCGGRVLENAHAEEVPRLRFQRIHFGFGGKPHSSGSNLPREHSRELILDCPWWARLSRSRNCDAYATCRPQACRL